MVMTSWLTVLNSQDDVSEVEASLLLSEGVVCRHLHHRPDHHEIDMNSFYLRATFKDSNSHRIQMFTKTYPLVISSKAWG